jgi:hypothetical protein
MAIIGLQIKSTVSFSRSLKIEPLRHVGEAHAPGLAGAAGGLGV